MGGRVQLESNCWNLSLLAGAVVALMFGAPACASSIQLSVFEKSSVHNGGSFVLVPSIASRPASVEDTPQFDKQMVQVAMLDGFGSVGAKGIFPQQHVEVFDSSVRASSFVRVPRWMRTGVSTPRNFSAFAPMIGACGQKAYLPSTLLSATAEGRRKILFPLVQQAACEAGLPVSLMDAMLIQESGYNPAAVSVKGAFGLGQLMPGTARYLGVDRYDIRGNLNGAARYLREHLTEFGDASLALAAYNAGPGRVRKSRGVPNISETKDYVRSILRNWFVLENNERSMSWQKQ